MLLTAPSHRQVKGVLWKEIRRLYKRARFPLGGELHAAPDSGLQFPDGREIVGFATVDPENMAGFSGNVLVIADEASGITDLIFEAIEGNMAGGGRIVMTSNPTQTSGRYYDAFHSDDEWHRIHITSVDCASKWRGELAAQGVDVDGPSAPKLAGLAWCEGRKNHWGERDPRYQVRVLGNFPGQGANAVISVDIVVAAEKRWSSQPDEGPLTIGVDVARFGDDSTSIVWARGSWVSKPVVIEGRDNVEVAEAVIEVVENESRLGETVSVRIDTTNNGGVADILRRDKDHSLELVEVVYAESAVSHDPDQTKYGTMRDLLWGSLAEWLERGGKIPPDKDLRRDLIAPTFDYDRKNRIRVEPKKDIKKRIGRSVDRGDATALAVFPAHLASEVAARLFDRKEFSDPARW